MKQAIALVAGAFTVFSLVGPALAADAPTAPAAAGHPAPPATLKAPTKHVSAEVVSVDTAGKTVKIKTLGRHKKEVTLGVDPEASATLPDLKAGDRIKVTYTDSHGQLTAKSIVKNENVAKK
jgi:Cu/Ag efflux protein CusF